MTVSRDHRSVRYDIPAPTANVTDSVFHRRSRDHNNNNFEAVSWKTGERKQRRSSERGKEQRSNDEDSEEPRKRLSSFKFLRAQLSLPPVLFPSVSRFFCVAFERSGPGEELRHQTHILRRGRFVDGGEARIRLANGDVAFLSYRYIK